MSDSQVGAAGENLLVDAIMLTSGGALTVARPTPDDDHRDILVTRRDGFQTLFIQVKTASNPSSTGQVTASAKFQDGEVTEHPAFWYAVILLNADAIQRLWLIPSTDFNALAYREPYAPGHVRLVFKGRADEHHDKWWPYIIEEASVGSRIESIIDAFPARMTAFVPRTLPG